MNPKYIIATPNRYPKAVREAGKVEKFRRDWLAALRSGDYRQTNYFLHDQGGHCCLGVAAEVAEKGGHINYKLTRDESDYLIGGSLCDDEGTGDRNYRKVEDLINTSTFRITEAGRELLKPYISLDFYNKLLAYNIPYSWGPETEQPSAYLSFVNMNDEKKATFRDIAAVAELAWFGTIEGKKVIEDEE